MSKKKAQQELRVAQKKGLTRRPGGPIRVGKAQANSERERPSSK